MFNFFTDKNKVNDRYEITGADYNHVKNVLRMRVGENLLVSFEKKSDLCVIETITDTKIIARVEQEDYIDTNLPVEIYLFQGLPKSDKMELIIQKAVELGVTEIIPVETARSIVKLDGKKSENKVSRWQTISESAAKQSKRNIIPTVTSVLTFSNAVKKANELDLVIIPYENEKGMKATKDALSKIKSGMRIGIFIGPEGGFEEKEVSAIADIGGTSVSLGKRILRAETAAITAVSMIMLHAEMNI